jgi:hypothetical protein
MSLSGMNVILSFRADGRGVRGQWEESVVIASADSLLFNSGLWTNDINPTREPDRNVVCQAPSHNGHI